MRISVSPVAALLTAGLLAACSPGASGPKVTPSEGESAQQEPETAGVAVAPSAVELTLPAEGAQAESPLDVEGVAPNTWFFEAVFPLKLAAKDGRVLAEAPAIAQSEWTKEGPVAFKGTLVFEVSEDTPAMLVLEEDMPGEGATPRRLERAVTLVPKK